MATTEEIGECNECGLQHNLCEECGMSDNQLVSRVIANEDIRNWRSESRSRQPVQVDKLARRLAPLGLSKIMSLVAYRMNGSATIPRTRQQPYVLMRGVVAVLAREVGYSFPMIGACLGIHHTTAIHALGRVREELAAGNSQLIQAMQSIRDGLK